MNIKQFINRAVLFVLFGLFIWQTILAIMKYMERTTITSSNNRDEGSILFPSITVCKNYLNGPNYLQIKNENVKVETLNRNLYNKIWSKKQVFYFFLTQICSIYLFPVQPKKGLARLLESHACFHMAMVINVLNIKTASLDGMLL